MLESGPGLSGTRKPKYKNPEVQAGFEKGEKILETHGLKLYDLDPQDYDRVPSNISREIGSVGAAAALWSGIHADEGAISPFQKTAQHMAFGQRESVGNRFFLQNFKVIL